MGTAMNRRGIEYPQLLEQSDNIDSQSNCSMTDGLLHAFDGSPIRRALKSKSISTFYVK